MKKQIVIEIDEDVYENLKNPTIYSLKSTMYHASRAADAVRSGTVLEPHGRLCDLDAALKCVDDDSMEDCDAKWSAIGLFDWAMSKRVVLEAWRNEE